MVFPRAALDDAHARIARLMSAVYLSRPLGEHPAQGCTCSIGPAQGSARPGETADALIHRADMALYAAKTSERDRAVASTER